MLLTGWRRRLSHTPMSAEHSSGTQGHPGSPGIVCEPSSSRSSAVYLTVGAERSVKVPLLPDLECCHTTALSPHSFFPPEYFK